MYFKLNILLSICLLWLTCCETSEINLGNASFPDGVKVYNFVMELAYPIGNNTIERIENLDNADEELTEGLFSFMVSQLVTGQINNKQDTPVEVHVAKETEEEYLEIEEALTNKTRSRRAVSHRAALQQNPRFRQNVVDASQMRQSSGMQRRFGNNNRRMPMTRQQQAGSPVPVSGHPIRQSGRFNGQQMLGQNRKRILANKGQN